MSREDGVFAKSLMNPPVIITTICALTSIILAFIFCTFYLMPEFGHAIIQFYFLYLIMSKLLTKPNTKKIKNIYNQQKQSIEITGGDGAQAMVQCNSSKISENNQCPKITKSINTEQRQPKRKPKMSKPSSEIKEKEELLQESSAIQLLSQIYDMTKSVLRDTRKVIKKFDQNEGTSKNSTEYIKTELQARQKEKESQSLLLDNVSPGEASGSLEIAPFLKNNSLRRITYHFNEIQSQTASNTNNNGSNISTITSIFTSFALIISLLLLKSGNEATTVKKTYYIHNEKTVFQNKGVAAQLNKSAYAAPSIQVNQAAEAQHSDYCGR